jgi:hypothetical protein
MSNNEDRNCNGDRKPFYTIAEAAIRWCNIRGRTIQVDAQGLPEDDKINPCLRSRAEEIMSATDDGVLACGRDGKSATDHVARPRRTIKHSDLKKWMEENFPGDKPPFLFDEVERQTHSAISVETYQALKAAHDAKEARVSILETKILEQSNKIGTIELQNKALSQQVEASSKMGTRERNNLLVVIAACCELAKLNPYDRGATTPIVGAIDRMGARLSDDTVRKILSGVKTALEMKQV